MGKVKNKPEIEWVLPNERGIIPVGKVHCSKSLKKIIKKNKFSISFNKNFNEVIKNCANRKETWINSTIYDLFVTLHQMGFAHSVEVSSNKDLVGGLYGLTLGSVFFAESMFSFFPNSSKLALIAIMAKINYGGFKVFDTQFPSKHLNTLGGATISKEEFEQKLYYTNDNSADFNRLPKLNNCDEFLKYGTCNK